MILIRCNELAVLIATTASVAKLHYKDMYNYLVKVSVKFCVYCTISIASYVKPINFGWPAAGITLAM